MGIKAGIEKEREEGPARQFTAGRSFTLQDDRFPIKSGMTAVIHQMTSSECDTELEAEIVDSLHAVGLVLIRRIAVISCKLESEIGLIEREP